MLDRYASCPTLEHVIHLTGRSWRIRAVADQDRLIDAVTDESDLDRFPYGLMLWPSAIALSTWLNENADILSGRCVLEMGAGVGLPGIVARSQGASVIQTDYLPEALALAESNARINAVSGIDRRLLDWRSPGPPISCDLIIASDVLYDRAVHGPLEETIKWAARPETRILIADPVRPQGFDFIERLERHRWAVEMSSQTVEWEGQQNEIALYDLRIPSA